MGYLQQLGPLAIASRLKSVTDLFMRDMISLYRKRGIDFEPRWFTFVHLLNTRGPLPITMIAKELNQSHPAANQVANALEKKGYIKSKGDKKDRRKRIIALSNEGKLLIEELTPIWNAVEQSVNELLMESSPEFLNDIHKIEQQLIMRPMGKRIASHLDTPPAEKIEIINYSPDYRNDFRWLNAAWLNAFFRIEAEDNRLLNNPETEILRKGGVIIFARQGKSIIGTGALLHIDQNICELTKMAVKPEFQGKQVGRKILRSLIGEARRKNYAKMILLTSEKLNKALSLYRSEGFTYSNEASVQKHNYERCTIQMELNLNNNSNTGTSL